MSTGYNTKWANRCIPVGLVKDIRVKILLPKTLAEPGTIPWALISSSNKMLEIGINDALHDLIDDYERRHIMPCAPSSSIKGVCSMLRITAHGAGAHDAGATTYDLIECKKHVGYEYVILFSLPNDKNLYHWVRKSWFPL